MVSFFPGRDMGDSRAKPMLNVLDALAGAVFFAMVTRARTNSAVAVVAEALPFTGRECVILLCEEKPTKKLAELVRDSRKHDTALPNTPVCSSASAGGIERANHEVAKQDRTLWSRTEDVYAIQLGMNNKLIPCRVADRDCATAQITKRSLSSPRQCTTKTLPRTLAKWTKKCHVGVWLGKSMTSDEHYIGTSAGVQRCRSIRRPWKGAVGVQDTTSLLGRHGLQRSMPGCCRRCAGVCITLDRQIKHGGTKGRPACVWKTQNAQHRVPRTF